MKRGNQVPHSRFRESKCIRNFRLGTIMLALALGAGGVFGKPPKSAAETITLVVMDPLSKELACACVKGYGQRDYRKLAARLEKAALGAWVIVPVVDERADRAL